VVGTLRSTDLVVIEREPPFSGAAFMAIALRSGALDDRSGRVVYPPAFDLVS